MRKALRSSARKTARRRPPEATAGYVPADLPTVTGLEKELAGLERLSLDELRLRWRNYWGRRAPAHLSRGLLFRVMAYRLQAEAFGDLDRKTVRLLERIADGSADKSAAKGSATVGSDEHAESKVSSARSAYEPLILKPGALLIREWQGRLERVTVVDDGFAWNGAIYASLSAVALGITGTKWNGHRFFGLRTLSRERGDDPNHEKPRRSVCEKAHSRPLPARGSSSSSGSATPGAVERVL